MCTEDKDKFENIAKELGCDESDDALDRAVEDLNLESKKDEDQKEEQDVLPLGVYTNRSGAGTSSIITGKELCADIAYYRKDRRDQMIQDQGLPTGDA